jgi:hypothetical protein
MAAGIPIATNNLECPVCGGRKQQAKHLVCSTCYEKYVANAGHALAKERKAIPLGEWVKPRIEARLSDLSTQLAQTQEDHSVLQDKVNSEAYEEVRASLGGQAVIREVFNTALREKKREIWGKEGGNRLHREMKILETKVNFLREFIGGLREREAQTESQEEIEVELPEE